MTERLTDRWRREIAEETAAVAAGTMRAEEAYAANAWPTAFIDDADRALTAFERDVAALGPDPADDTVWAAVERVTVALNAVDGRGDHHIDTVTREELCDYIDETVASAGIDVAALTGRRGLDPSALTDQWRDW